jgi:hypothetical protein
MWGSYLASLIKVSGSTWPQGYKIFSLDQVRISGFSLVNQHSVPVFWPIKYLRSEFGIRIFLYNLLPRGCLLVTEMIPKHTSPVWPYENNSDSVTMDSTKRKLFWPLLRVYPIYCTDSTLLLYSSCTIEYFLYNWYKQCFNNVALKFIRKVECFIWKWNVYAMFYFDVSVCLQYIVSVSVMEP